MQENKNIEAELLSKIQLVAQTLDEIDDIFEKQREEMQRIDWIESDLDHLIENTDLNDISNDAKIAIYDKKNEVRIIRRQWSNVNSIKTKYYEVNNRLLHKQNRPFFISSMKQVIGNLNNPYKNRVMSEEDVQSLLSTKNVKKTPSYESTKRKNHKRVSEEEINQIMEMAHSGIKAKEIGALMNMKENTIYKIIKRYEDVI